MQAVLTFVSPYILVFMVGKGLKRKDAMKGMWAFTTVAALAFLAPQFLAARFIGPELGDIIGAGNSAC